MPPRPDAPTSPPLPRPSYGAAALVTLLVFALYLATISPTTWFWDTSEYIAVAYRVGIPHPPGNPLFVLLGRVASLLPIAEGIALRLNLMTAAASAVSAGLWFLVAERVLARWLPARWMHWLGAGVAALLGATAFTVWNQSVVTEKVYTIALLGMAIVSWLTLRWVDEPDGRRADRVLVLIAYLLGLTYANHMAGFLPGPAVTLAVLLRRPRTLLRWRLLLACIVALAGGMTVFATQPIRAAFNPPINEGEPTACTDGRGFRLECTLTRTTWDRFAYHFNRKQYGKPPLVERQAPFGAQLGMWWLYFKWQWVRDVHGERPATQQFLALAFLALGLLGGYTHWRRDRAGFWYVGTMVALTTVVLVYYMNFKYGWSQAPRLGTTVEREVRDRDYFYLWSFSLWGVWAGLGIVTLWRDVAEWLGSRAGGGAMPARRHWALAAPVLALALVPLVGNWRTASRANDTTAREWARDVLNSVEPYGVLFTVGDNDSFPLWYAQQVEGVRTDVTVALWPYLGTDWYVRQLIRQPVREYDAAAGPALYRGRAWPKPSRPILALTADEADSIPELLEFPVAQRFSHRNIELAIPAGSYMLRNDAVILRTIKDTFPERPVYFTQGSYGRLALRPYLLEQGLVSRLVDGAPVASRDTVPMDGGGHLDVRRTVALFDSVYRAPEAIVRRGDWVDRASVGIAIAYLDTGVKAAFGSRVLGDSTRAARIDRRVAAVARAARLEQFLQPAPAEVDDR